MPAAPGIDLSPFLQNSPHKDRILEILAEAHSWLCKENAEAVSATLEERGWMSSFSLQPDVPFPERK
jgi:hypothetical protein